MTPMPPGRPPGHKDLDRRLQLKLEAATTCSFPASGPNVGRGPEGVTQPERQPEPDGPDDHVRDTGLNPNPKPTPTPSQLTGSQRATLTQIADEPYGMIHDQVPVDDLVVLLRASLVRFCPGAGEVVEVTGWGLHALCQHTPAQLAEVPLRDPAAHDDQHQGE